MIRLATLNDKNEIMALIYEAIEDMNKKNIEQWDAIYPNIAIIEHDLDLGTLYKYEYKGNIAAIIVINNQGSPEYDEIQWADKTENYIVAHRLTVHPAYQGQGIGRKLLLFCENIALQNKKLSIRLDAFVKNPIAVNLYRLLGYMEKGLVKFRKGLFYCFEKMMNSI